MACPARHVDVPVSSTNLLRACTRSPLMVCGEHAQIAQALEISCRNAGKITRKKSQMWPAIAVPICGIP